MGLKSFRSALLLGAAALGMSAASAALTPAYAQEATRTYAIEPQELDDALREFGRQTGRDILFSPYAVVGKRSPGVQGQMTERQALDALLAGTGLTFQQTPSNGYAVQDPASPTQLGAADTGAEEEIVVTGTNLRGSAPIGANVFVLDDHAIAQTGYGSVQDVLETLPQNVGGNNAEVTGGIAGNFGAGTAVNLRGLGAGTTLTLVNGRRQAPSGNQGNFVDVSAIPVAAIQRIEVLADGASAIYGADAVGGVVNIILRRDYDGAETILRAATADGDSEELQASQSFATTWRSGGLLAGYQYYHRDALARGDRSYATGDDKTPFGGSDFSTNFSNPGNILNAFFQPAYAIPSGQDGTNLTPADLLPGVINHRNSQEGAWLLPQNTTQSFFFSGHQELNASLELYADMLHSTREYERRSPTVTTFLFVPSSNPFYVDPFGGGAPVVVTYNFIDDLGPRVAVGEIENLSINLGLRMDLGPRWRFDLSALYGEVNSDNESRNEINFGALGAALADSNPATAFNPFADGSNTNPATLAAISQSFTNASNTTIRELNGVLDGNLFELPAGPARLAIGFDLREESFANNTTTELTRDVQALFGELGIPLLEGASANSPLLELSLAGRYEEYSDFGSTFNPKIGLRYSPTDWFAIRGSWGTSFRPPNLQQLEATPLDSVIAPLFDPAVGGFSTTIIRQGNNPNLTEETSTSWTVGLDLRPQWLPQQPGNVSVTYYEVDYTDRIITPGGNLFSVLANEALWAPIITRSPSAADLAEPCSRLFSGDCVATPPTVLVDARLRNIAGLLTRGVDVAIDQRFDIGDDTLTLALNANYITDFQQQLSSATSFVEFADTVGNPAALRVRGLLSYQHGGTSAMIALNYVGDMVDTASLPERDVDDWTTIDLGLSQTLSTGLGGTDDAEISLRVNNVFDEDPPFVNTVDGFDPANASPLGRLIALEVRKRW